MKLGNDSVIVITGASTGIGRAAALEFAKRQVSLVLVARQIEKLAEVARECESLGSRCDVQTLDVADSEAVEALASRLPRIDVWVNNAGVGVVGSFTDVPMKDHRRVIETNVIGTMNGAHAALTRFKKQKFGTLINVASIAARLPTPLLSSYTTSKFAIRGLTHSIGQDLKMEGFKHIHVCQLNPSVVDTPAFHHTANFSGKAIRMRFPMTTAKHVAEAIVGLAVRPRREVFVGPLAGLGAFAYTVLPGFTSWVVTQASKMFYFGAKTEKTPDSGNLFQPIKDSTAKSGGWKSGETKQV